MKRIIFTTIISLFIVMGSFAQTYTSTCGAEGDGSNLKWSLDVQTGVLTISGTGVMKNYGADDTWYSYHAWIKSLVIEEGITTILETMLFFDYSRFTGRLICKVSIDPLHF